MYTALRSNDYGNVAKAGRKGLDTDNVRTSGHVHCSDGSSVPGSDHCDVCTICMSKAYMATAMDRVRAASLAICRYRYICMDSRNLMRIRALRSWDALLNLLSHVLLKDTGRGPDTQQRSRKHRPPTSASDSTTAVITQHLTAAQALLYSHTQQVLYTCSRELLRSGIIKKYAGGFLGKKLRSALAPAGPPGQAKK